MRGMDVGYILFLVGIVFLIISLVMNTLDIEGWRLISILAVLFNILGAIFMVWFFKKMTRD